MDRIDRILRDTGNRLILREAKEGLNISQIKEKVPLTYSSIFNKIKEMEKEGLIKIIRNPNGNEIKISKKYKKEVEDSLMKLQLAGEFIKIQFPSDKEKQELMEFLKDVGKERFMVTRDILKKYPLKFLVVRPHLEELGFIEERIELKKFGREMIKTYEKNKSKIIF